MLAVSSGDRRSRMDSHERLLTVIELFEDCNTHRGVGHAVAGPADLAKLRYMLQDPTQEQLAAHRKGSVQP